MYLCNCKAVTDVQIRRLVQQGVHTIGEVSAYFGVGNECGKCVADIHKFLDTCLATPLPPSTVEAPPPVPLMDTTPLPAVEKPPQQSAWFAVDM